jgi:hypothetical protein
MCIRHLTGGRDRRFEMKKSKVLLAVLAGCAFSSSAQAGIVVQTELSLLLDISGSVDAQEYALQRNGYVTAFQSAAVKALVVPPSRVLVRTCIPTDMRIIARRSCVRPVRRF